MTTTVWTDRSDLSSAADTALTLTARFWFLVAVAGQWIFLVYVIAFYGGSAIRGQREAWNQVIPNGYTPGATLSNVAVAVHLSLAVIIMAGGPLQLLPGIRRRAPVFHRWNGRVYTLTVFVTSIVGLYMVWSRGRAELVQRVGISLDAVLIMTFAFLAVRSAIGRNLRTHRHWALRLLMVVNAGWFFRIGLMQWIFLNHGPADFDPKTFRGPFLSFLSFADYALPLILLEIYLRASDRGSPAGRFVMAAALMVATIATGVAIFAATMVLWLPHIRVADENRSCAHTEACILVVLDQELTVKRTALIGHPTANNESGRPSDA